MADQRDGSSSPAIQEARLPTKEAVP